MKKAALLPVIHHELWARYQGNLPDDAVIKRYLVVDKKFNDQYVDEFISQFRRTIQFANLSPDDTVEEAGEDIDSQPDLMTQTPPETRPPITLPTRKTPQIHGVAPPIVAQAPLSDDLSLPLGNGKSVRIPKMYEDDYDLFLETLKLWKRKLILPAPLSAAKETFPFIVMWKNKVGDQPVKIIGVMGEKDGQKYYESEDGTGIPASEIPPNSTR